MSDKSTTFGGAVGRFFFAPTDPTTLGFMRILTGLLVLYTHLTYSLDLQAFFGPKAWWDHEIANRQRREVPIYVAPLGWDGFDPVIRVEDAPHRRVAVLEFLRKIPLEPADRVGKLRFLDTLLRRPGDEQVQALRLPNEAARLTDDQHKRVTAALASPTFNPADSPVTFPTFVLNLLPSERIAFWNDVLQFNTILPADSERLEYVLSWLTSYPNFPGPERRLLYQFLVGERKDAKGKDLSLPKDATTRDEYLKYLDFWAGDPRQYPALGLPIFSVWFHITNPATMWLVHTAFLVAFGLFTVGLFTRVTSVLTWFGTLCYIHHSQVTLFGQDTMQTILVFYLMIAPSGATLSLDALRKRFRAAKVLMAAGGRPVPWADAALAGPQPSWLANVMVRMFQIHFCVIYMSSGLSKLKGTTWWNHSAGWMTLVR